MFNPETEFMMAAVAVREYVMLMRPVGWSPFIFALVFGILDSGIHRFPAAILFLIWGPLCLGSMAILNFHSDRLTDSLNPYPKDTLLRRQPFVSGKISARNGLALAAILAVSGLALSLLLGSGVFFTASAFLALHSAYSAGPRIKSVPFGDMILNSSAGAISYAVPWVYAGTFPPIVTVAWISFFIAGLYMLTMLADRETDAAAGIKTTAVYLGMKRAALLGFLAYLGSAALFALLFSAPAGVHYYLMAPLVAAGTAVYASVLLRPDPAFISRLLRLVYFISAFFCIALLALYLFRML